MVVFLASRGMTGVIDVNEGSKDFPIVDIKGNFIREVTIYGIEGAPQAMLKNNFSFGYMAQAKKFGHLFSLQKASGEIKVFSEIDHPIKDKIEMTLGFNSEEKTLGLM
jgi:hypothetical protein